MRRKEVEGLRVLEMLTGGCCYLTELLPPVSTLCAGGFIYTSGSED